MIWNILIEFIGSLGIFLYALELISKESQKIFGENIKEYLKKLTQNKYKSIATGAIVTGIIQSSSVVSVLIVSLVNSGILTLKDSIGLILGTNIGTTATGWIFSFKITNFSIPLIAIGSTIYFFSSKEIQKSKGKFIFGFGLLLLGLQYMSSSINPLRNNADFIALFTLFKADTYSNIIKIVAIGTVVTAIIQSSSAAVGIILTLALQGLINLETILALILGTNIGTTITPVISALNSNYEAKRTALLCFFIKFILAIFFIIIFPSYVKIIEILTASNGIAIKTAVANTFVNVINTLIFLPFFGTIERMFANIYKEKVDKKSISVTELNTFLEITSNTMINIFNKEIIKVMNIIEEIFEKNEDKKSYKKITLIEKEVLEYFILKSNTLEKNIDSFKIYRYIKILIELKIIAKYLLKIKKSLLKENLRKEIMNFYKVLNIIFDDIRISYEDKKVDQLETSYENILFLEKEISSFEEKESNLENLKILTLYKRIIVHFKDLVKLNQKIFGGKNDRN